MSLKQEIETWVAALARYDNNEFDDAIAEFSKISDTSKILFNMGVIHATLGEHEKAVECYQRAIRLDQYFAVAYFQQGVSNFLIGDFEEALANFNDTLLYLRGNSTIDYAQLGLLFKLYSCEVLFNRGLCYIYLQQKEAGLQDLGYAVKEKVVEDHNVIDEAIREEAEVNTTISSNLWGYTVFSIPVGVVYRPNEAKVRNLKTKDYLGKARLVAASDRGNAFTGFAGSEMKAAKAETRDDRPLEAISFAASHLVKPGLQSRRQQSEPPTNRNVFPPTPPPEAERLSRGASLRNSGSRPALAKLSILTTESGRKYEKSGSPQDRGSAKTASPQDQRSAKTISPQDGSRSDKAFSPQDRFRPSRSASAAAAPSRAFSQREQAWRPSRPIEEEGTYDGETYDPYADTSRGSKQGRSRNQPRYDEEDEEASDYDAASFDEGEFEMVSNMRHPSRSNSRAPRAGSRRPEIRKVRVKVHADDVRYIMIGTTCDFTEFVERIQEKMGLRSKFKIKLRDEDVPEDMITMGDQDDLDMAIESAKSSARRERLDVGKMEAARVGFEDIEQQRINDAKVRAIFKKDTGEDEYIANRALPPAFAYHV
ncbi:Neutrophil cytosol factor 2 [Cladobotryum mycophilum]|uniref:Neutrophil cytosol factor 2 n=1 Tax=Cladobotryum mycophilum TaxID=491253 RepID=A0ABR0SS32_9HYPO